MVELDVVAAIAAGAGLLTAGMNVYTFVGTNRQIGSLIETVNNQGQEFSESFGDLSATIRDAQRTTRDAHKLLGRLIDRIQIPP
jgi:hypothetical protein